VGEPPQKIRAMFAAGVLRVYDGEVEIPSKRLPVAKASRSHNQARRSLTTARSFFRRFQLIFK